MLSGVRYSIRHKRIEPQADAIKEVGRPVSVCSPTAPPRSTPTSEPPNLLHSLHPFAYLPQTDFCATVKSFLLILLHFFAPPKYC